MHVGDGLAEWVGVGEPAVGVGAGEEGGVVVAGEVAGADDGAVLREALVLADGPALDAEDDGLPLGWVLVAEATAGAGCADASADTASPMDAECPGPVEPTGASAPSAPPMTATATAPSPPTTRPATDSTTMPRCRPRGLRRPRPDGTARSRCGGASAAGSATGSAAGWSARAGCPAYPGVVAVTGTAVRAGIAGPTEVPELPHPGQDSAPLRCRRQAMQ